MVQNTFLPYIQHHEQPMLQEMARRQFLTYTQILEVLPEMVLEIQAPLHCITTSVALLQAVEQPPETMQLDFIQRQGLLALQAMELPRQLDCTYRREPQVFLVNQANQ
jgi:hypothetical protein